jgi:hypothetical protein
MRYILRKTLWRSTDFQTDSNDNRIEWKLRRIERVLKNVRDFVACQCSKSQTERESDSVNAFMIRFRTYFWFVLLFVLIRGIKY